MPTELLPILSLICRVLLNLAMLVGVFYVFRWMRKKNGRLERIGRWSTLERHFSTPAMPTLYTNTSGLVGMGTYEDTLKLAYTDTGIFLGLPWLFRFGSKPIFIPYSELTVSEANPTLRYRFRTYTQFTVRGQSVCIAQDDAKKILARLPQRHGGNPAES